MWMKVDDGLHAHRKTRKVTKSAPTKGRDAAPMGLWVLAGSWAAQNGTDGWVPEDELDRFDDDWHTLAARLVRAGYWWPSERDGEPGYGFNDWLDYNPESEAASRSGSFGNHVRWHANRGHVDTECEHCPKEPVGEPEPVDNPDSERESGGDIGGRSGGESGSESRSIALPVPDPTRPDPNPAPVVSAEPPRRDDVEAICQHLAEQVEATGSKRPAVTAKWRNEARLMLDRDGRTEEQVHACIRWLYDSNHPDALFWRPNVRAVPKLRAEYDRLRQLAERAPRSGGTSRNEEWKSMQERQMARAIEREREMGIQ